MATAATHRLARPARDLGDAHRRERPHGERQELVLARATAQASVAAAAPAVERAIALQITSCQCRGTRRQTAAIRETTYWTRRQSALHHTQYS